MLTLNDGRTELWQYDTARTLSIDADCSQVHFSNKVFGRSIDVDVVNGVAIIPDILLQTDKDLNVWAFVGTAENGYTKISKVFKINHRNKPADYVFTPTDQNTLGQIIERIEELEKRPSGGNGGITNETDPTVPDWAKQPNKPTYTADEVGAQPATLVVTVDKATMTASHSSAEIYAHIKSGGNATCEYNSVTLHYSEGVSSAVAFTSNIILVDRALGLSLLIRDKAVTFDEAEYTPSHPVTSVNGETGDVQLNAENIGAIPAPATAEVGQTIVVKAVDDNGVPTEWEAVEVKGGKELKLLADLTPENVQELTVTEDMDGNPLAEQEVYIEIYRQADAFNVDGNVNLYSTNGDKAILYWAAKTSTNDWYHYINAVATGTTIFADHRSKQTEGVSYSLSGYMYRGEFAGAISKIEMLTANSNYPFQAGDTVKIYGWR